MYLIDLQKIPISHIERAREMHQHDVYIYIYKLYVVIVIVKKPTTFDYLALCHDGCYSYVAEPRITLTNYQHCLA